MSLILAGGGKASVAQRHEFFEVANSMASCMITPTRFSHRASFREIFMPDASGDNNFEQSYVERIRERWNVVPTKMPIGHRQNLRPAMSDDVKRLVQRLGLDDGMGWLLGAMPRFFPGSSYGFSISPAFEEGEEDILRLEVYSNMERNLFLQRRRALCDAMERAGHSTLYIFLVIMQQTAENHGR